MSSDECIECKFDSTSLKNGKYYPDGVLEITFHGGAVYQYSGVGPETFDNLVKSESNGKYFAKFIKGKFEYKKIKEPSTLAKKDE